MSRTLIKGGCVLTLGARTPNYEQADVLIEDQLISEIGVGLRSRGAEVVDASGTIVMPGFVDGHRHAWKSLLRTSGTDQASETTSRSLSPDDLYAATLVSLLGAVEAGITTVVDWGLSTESRPHRDAALRAHAESGLRTVLVTSSLEADLETSGSTTVALGPDDLDPEAMVEEVRAAREQGIRIHLHCGIGGRSDDVVRLLADSGLLGDAVTLVHCTTLDVAGFDAIASTGAGVVLTPVSEMTNGLGLPPMQPLLDRRIRPGLGVDSDADAPADLFAQLRAANSVQHASLFDLKLAGKGGIPNLLTTRDVIRYGTIEGAKAIGLESVTGSLEPGKQADVLVLRADTPNIYPVNDPIGAVVWGMDTSNVDWVFCSGKPIVREGIVAGSDVARELAADTAGRMTAESASSRIGGSA